MNERVEKRFKIARLILLAACIVAMYLLALNGRYIKMNEYYVFDKWTQTIKP